MIMETEIQSGENTGEVFDTKTNVKMAPQDTDDGGLSEGEMSQTDQKENKDPLHNNAKFEVSSQGVDVCNKNTDQMVSADEGEAGDAEDGEILEDGEIASDQDGEIQDNEAEEGEEKSGSEISSPTKRSSGRHGEDHRRRGHDKHDRHSKRRRTSKEESHRDKQKKRRHKEHSDTGDDYDSSWSDSKRDKSDRKRDSPSHDSLGEDRYKDDKRRRGSGESRHHRDRGRDRDKSGADKDKSRDRSKDKHDRGDKSERKDRWSKDKSRNYSDDYDSPPGIYDSPSDDEYDATRYSEKKPKFGDADFMEMGQHHKGKKKQHKKFDRRRQRIDRSDDFEEEAPPRKKPLLKTPMDERPVCRFFKEGKCQKGPECPFNHDYQPEKRFELCKYHLQSQCRKEDCVFMHEDFPCKYYHTGSTCYQGDNCKFSHAPLTAETDAALQQLMKDKEEWEEEFGERKHKKKGLLGDQPQMSEEEIQQKLESMKSIPSIFDIETHKPGESPSKPPVKKGQAQGIRPQGMTPQTGPNMRFSGPQNQMGAMNRPPFMGQGPNMEGPPMGMQGPPPMVSGPMVSGTMVSGAGLMGPGPAPMMSAPGMPPPGMQGPPMGPPMSQAAALVGAILRAAPMFQQFRGPSQQGPNTTVSNMPGDPRFMGPMVGQIPNMEAPNLMVPPPNMVTGTPIMSPGQDGMMGDNQAQTQQGMMGDQGQASPGQGQVMPGQEMGQQMNQSIPQMGQTNAGNFRDPRKVGPQNDPRIKKGMESDSADVDMRQVQTMEQKNKTSNFGDEDFRQDMDFRQQDNNSNQGGDNTPQQDWGEESMDLATDDDDLEIPSHLPPKQREMFLRIRQHTMKIKKEKSSEQAKQLEKQESKREATVKMDDDNWYSSDEDDQKPNVSNIISSLSQMGQQTSDSAQTSTATSSINVMQMINAIKSSNPAPTASRPSDPRMQPRPALPPREPVEIHSREGDCPWRLCRVLYVKQRIPQNIDLNDTKYKMDPRVQKMLKLQELESGKVIDHTKTVVPAKGEFHRSTSDHRLPDLLDPKVFQEKQGSIPRPELTPFVDPVAGMKSERLEQVYKPEMPNVQRPVDPRMKPVVDPRVQRMSSTSGIPARPMDPRLSRQDSSSGIPSVTNVGGRPFDPRLARQDSQDSLPRSRGSTPPLDPRVMSRQFSSSIEPKLENLPSLPLDLGLDVKVLDVHRQTSQPGTSAEKDAAKDSSKPKLDYRNDPRFKRKKIVEPSASPESNVKRFSGQRKSSTEYSSPLGGDINPQIEESGYNSYNRPRVTKPPAAQQPSTNVTKSESVPSSDLSTHDILDSLQIMPPPGLQEPPPAEKNLKDIFKTIDPTASPFC